MVVQLFEDSEQDGIVLYDATYHLHASQIQIKYNFFAVKNFPSCSMSVVFTVKVVGPMHHKLMKYNFSAVKYLLSCSMSVVLTVKVVGPIRPPLGQMPSSKACYKLGLKYK